MSITDLRKQAKKKLDALAPDKLRSAVDYIDFLSKQPANSSLTRLLKSRPPIGKRIKEAQGDVAAGRVVNWRDVRDDV